MGVEMVKVNKFSIFLKCRNCFSIARQQTMLHKKGGTRPEDRPGRFCDSFSGNNVDENAHAA
jgi:hypothetical protein